MSGLPPQRQNLPPEHAVWEQKIDALSQAFGVFSVLMEERMATVLAEVKLTRQNICELQNTANAQQRELDRHKMQIDELAKDLKMTTDTLVGFGEVLSGMKPWVGGLKWALPIIGTAILLAGVAAIYWAIGQSGAGLP